MSTPSYDVKIWKLQTIARRNGTKSYGVRWTVAKRPKRKTFRTKALAESFRSELISAARRGEAFDVTSGRPVTWAKTQSGTQSWYDFACEYVDMKWKHSAATTRRSRAEALMTITIGLLPTIATRPDERVLRDALRKWAFNTANRNDPAIPANIEAAMQWTEQNAPPVSVLADPDILRHVLDAVGSKLDGKPASPNVANRKRMVLSNVIRYAIEREHLSANPLPSLNGSGTTYRRRGTLDRRVVINPQQARDLLAAVAKVERSGPRLIALFACMYYAALRPEEVVNLREQDLSLPEKGWGEIHLWETYPDAGADWTDSGQTRDHRGLKHRAAGDTRSVPCPPALTRILHDHLSEYGTRRDGRLFWGERGGALDSSTYERVWQKARAIAFGEDVAAKSLLARRPYDLRHAAVSTWLGAGMDATEVAEWAGQSVAVLYRVYAACISGRTRDAQRRVEQALGEPDVQ